MRVSAVVLAGGRSARFGRDKLAEPLDGETVLWRTIGVVRAIADDIVVVTAPDATQVLPADVAEVHDGTPGGGPLIGAIAGLAHVRYDAVVLVGGDMPWMRADVLRLMLACLVGPSDAVVLGSDGRVQHLPLVLRRDPALSAARRLVEAGERRLGALAEALEVTTIADSDWRAIDPGADTLHDIDTVADLPSPPG